MRTSEASAKPSLSLAMDEIQEMDTDPPPSTTAAAAGGRAAMQGSSGTTAAVAHHSSTAADSLPWVEKYRPNALEDLVSHTEIVRTLSKLMDAGNLPNLLFYGPPGTGKTSTMLACARQLYGKSISSMVLELNASDARGIDVVRNEIQNFASTRLMFNNGTKLVILDECDAMTNDAQFALRRVIEKYVKNVRFCMICNYVGKIISALQSRCTKFRFGPLSEEQMLGRLEEVIEAEKVQATPDGVQALLTCAQGDMRKTLNVLQVQPAPPHMHPRSFQTRARRGSARMLRPPAECRSNLVLFQRPVREPPSGQLTTALSPAADHLDVIRSCGREERVLVRRR